MVRRDDTQCNIMHIYYHVAPISKFMPSYIVKLILFKFMFSQVGTIIYETLTQNGPIWHQIKALQPIPYSQDEPDIPTWPSWPSWSTPEPNLTCLTQPLQISVTQFTTNWTPPWILNPWYVQNKLTTQIKPYPILPLRMQVGSKL